MCRFFLLSLSLSLSRHSEQELYISPTLYLGAPPPSPFPSLFNIYLRPLMSSQSAAQSHPIPFLVPSIAHSYLPLSALPPIEDGARAVCFEFNCAYFLPASAALPSLSAAGQAGGRWSVGRSVGQCRGLTAASPAEFCDDAVGAANSLDGVRPPVRPSASRPTAAVMRLAASFSNFDDVVSPLATGKGASSLLPGNNSSRLTFRECRRNPLIK